jgi:hypothetical protein
MAFVIVRRSATVVAKYFGSRGLDFGAALAAGLF